MGVKAIVLLSGGIDSAAALARAVRAYGSDAVYALSCRYGQKSLTPEMHAASRLASHYNVARLVVDLPLDKFARSSLISGQGGALAGAPTVVPGRNLVFLSVAASFAASLGAAEVWFGGHAGDAAVYPDCRPEFVAALNACLWCEDSAVKIVQPFAGLEKRQVVEKARSLGVPLELTWSCYQPDGGQPCGICGACKERGLAWPVNQERG